MEDETATEQAPANAAEAGAVNGAPSATGPRATAPRTATSTRRPRPMLALPTLALAPASLTNLDADLSREWLVTNGLGGYAMGTVAGATTRSYHGWLVAALTPPLGRTTLVTKADEMTRLADGTEIALGTNEYADGTIDPRGYERLTAFALEGLIPCVTYWLGAGATLTRRLWMEHGHNLTYAQYTYQVDRALATLATLPPGAALNQGARPTAALGAITLSVSPYCVTRDHHSSVHATPDQRFLVAPLAESVGGAGGASQIVRASADAPPIHLLAGPTARFAATGVWYWRVEHRAERARGLGDVEDVYQPGVFSVTLAAGQTATFAFYTPLASEMAPASANDQIAQAIAGLGGASHEELAAAALAREQARQRGLLARAEATQPGHSAPGDTLIPRLTLDADQFLVARALPPSGATPDGMLANQQSGSPEAAAMPVAAASFTVSATATAAQPAASAASAAPIASTTEASADAAGAQAAAPLAAGVAPGVTVIAGYPWFTDWGRDTMIALPGLTLATGRYAEARGLLRCFVAAMSQGMIPNRFPDGPANAAPEYNTVDATLWLFHALDAYLTTTDDWSLLDELFAPLAESVVWHERGTRYGIGVDPKDGLLRGGATDVRLTWMDAKIGDWVVTPRRGKQVEINALWYRALTLMGGWARRLGRDAATYDRLSAQLAANFLARFWYDAGGYLYDVVDVDGVAGAVDWSLRPNQVIALAVAPTLIPLGQARRILAITERELLTPLGLRTLAPSDPRFIGVYGGDQRARDAAYHQGTVWPWLLGPYANAHAWVQRADDDLATTSAAREAPPDGVALAEQRERHEHREREWRAALLAPFRAHLREAGLGSVSEIAEGAAPFALRGCVAQAWSVAELLRIALL